MQVIAFQDPETGQFFGTQALLDEHLSGRAAAVQERQAEENAKSRMAELQFHVANNMATPADLVRLTSELYTEFLPLMHALARPGRGKDQRRAKPIALVSVAAQDYVITPATSTAVAEFACNLEVVLSSEPWFECNPAGGDITPYELLAGFASGCGGCHCLDDGTYRMSYYMRAPLSKLPKMVARLQELKELYGVKVDHDDAVRAAEERASAQDEVASRLRSELIAAREALTVAAKKHEQCAAELTARDALVRADAAAQTPFVQAEQWGALLDGFGDSLDMYASDDAPTALRYLAL